MKTFLSIFLLLSLASCKSTKNIIAGRYTNQLDFENHTELLLHKNQTYSFQQQMGLVFFEGAGNWRVSNDTLFLMNKDSVLLNGSPEKKQSYLIKKSGLEEIAISKSTNLKLKKPAGKGY